MRDSVNGNSSTLTLTITSKPIQQNDHFKAVQDCTLQENHSNLNAQNNFTRSSPNIGQIIGQLSGAMQSMDPKAAAFRAGLRMMGEFANQLNNQSNNSFDDYSSMDSSFGGGDDLISSLMGFDNNYDYDDEDQDDQNLFDLLGSLNSLWGDNSQSSNNCSSSTQNKKHQQLKSINNLMGSLADGLSSGAIPPGMSGSANQLISQLSKQADCLNPMQNPVSGFSPGLSLAITLLRK